MKEIDIVRLKEDFEGIKKNTTGTIVYVYDDKYCEVEFTDENHDTIDVVTTPFKLLELVKAY